jgi:N-acetylglucosaminyldiphosphoundecaprenol N-acetyl-beta-D-mannosaminyltransferase
LPERIVLSGVPVDPLTVEALHERLAGHIERREHALVLHVNVHAMNFAARLAWFGDLLRRADLVFCDGIGVVLGARILGRRIPQRITYADWMWELGRFCAARGYSLYFLGAKPGVAERAAQRLQNRFPELKIPGAMHGYFDKRPGSAENQRVIEEINRARPQILLVGMGMPVQERWLLENWDSVHANIALTGGAVFDYVSGGLKRPPAWMRDNHLEWMGRLWIEPGRLWKRYVFGNPAFLLRILKERIGLGVRASETELIEERPGPEDPDGLIRCRRDGLGRLWHLGCRRPEQLPTSGDEGGDHRPDHDHRGRIQIQHVRCPIDHDQDEGPPSEPEKRGVTLVQSSDGGGSNGSGVTPDGGE